MKKPRNRSDFATYTRLLSYLRGFGVLCFAVFFFIVLEALSTVGTISTLKPILHLLENKPIVEISDGDTGLGLEIGTPKTFPDGATVFRVGGELQSHDAARKLHSAVKTSVARTTGPAVVDLSDVTRIDAEGIASLLQLKLDMTSSSKDLRVVLPAGMNRPTEPADAANFHLLTEAESAPLQSQYLAAVPPLAQSTRSVSNNALSFKKRLMNYVTPPLVRLQDYAAQDTDSRMRVLAIFVGLMVGFGMMTAICGYVVGYLSKHLAFSVVRRLRNHVFGHMMGLDLAYFSAHPPGALMSHVMQDVKAVEGAVDLLFSNVIKTPITVIVLITAMLMISPSLTLYTFIVVPALAGLLFIVGRKIRRVSGRVQKSMGVLTSIMEEAINGVRVVKASNMEQREGERFAGENTRIFKMGMRTNAAEEMGQSLTQIIGMIMVGAILLLGARYILGGEMRSSEFVLFAGFLVRLFQPLKAMSKTTSRLQRGLAGCDRVFHVLDMRAKIVDSPGAVPAEPLRRAIEFKNVSFQYSEERGPVLRNVNLTLRAGRAIALVGETGSGKSTMVNLLPRFYDPTDGQITYDGVDLRQLQVTTLRDQIAIVTQDPVLFNDTIANNIAYGYRQDETPSRAGIESAAKAAKLHEFILQLPNGYETVIGSRGSLLSGGQKQRLAIARAIFRDAPILILDEATSSLDSETEALIQEALNILMQNRTTVVVAHRLSTIQRCDEIYVMDKGQFIEHGTHDELLRKNGRYARFYQIQFGRDVA